MPARMLDLEGGWIVMSHIGWEGEQTTIYRVWKPSPSRRVLKSLEGKPERESPKRTISASGESGALNRGSHARKTKMQARVDSLGIL